MQYTKQCLINGQLTLCVFLNKVNKIISGKCCQKDVTKKISAKYNSDC